MRRAIYERQQQQRKPLGEMSLSTGTDSSYEQSPIKTKKRRKRRTRKRVQPLSEASGSSGSDTEEVENNFRKEQREHVKTPIRNRTKSTTQQRPRGAEIFTPVKPPALPASDLPAGVRARSMVCKKDIEGLKEILRDTPSLVHDTSEVGENGSIEAGLTVLHVACQLGLDRFTELILRLCPDLNINVTTESGQTALHYACSQGHATCVELLINAGAKVHLRDILDQTAADVAGVACLGDWDTCVELIDLERTRIGLKAMKIGTSVFAAIGVAIGVYYFLKKK